MKLRKFAGLLSIVGGVVIASIWVFVFFRVQSVELGEVVEHILSMLSGGDTLEFFSYSVLCVLGCFTSGALFIIGKHVNIGIVIVIVNSVAVSVMFAWFVAALVASPLLFSSWVIRNS